MSKIIMSARSFSKLVKRLLVLGAGRRKSMLQKASGSGVAKLIASRGHFIVYTVDQKRYMVPIMYLENETIRGMLERSEDEFGHLRSRTIVLPCDAYFMVHMVLLNKRTVTELEKAMQLSRRKCRERRLPASQQDLDEVFIVLLEFQHKIAELTKVTVLSD